MVKVEIIPDSVELIKMSDEEYFGSYKNYISNSRLGFLNESEGGSIEKFLEGFKSEYSESFELGSAVHSIILQPDSYFISKITKPSGKLGIFVEHVFDLRQKSNIKISDAIQQASVSADYYSGKLSATRLKTALEKGNKYYFQRLKNKNETLEKLPIYLSEAVRTKATTCITEIYNNPNFIEKIRPEDLNITSCNEYAIFCDVKVTIDDVEYIVKLKGKLDNFTIDEENNKVTLNDLKTSGKPAKFFMGNMVKVKLDGGEEKEIWYNGSFQKYHYYRQVALYAWMLQAALKQYYNLQDYKLEVNMLVVETTPNFKTGVFKVNNKYIQAGLKEFKELITKLVQCNLQNKM